MIARSPSEVCVGACIYIVRGFENGRGADLHACTLTLQNAYTLLSTSFGDAILRVVTVSSASKGN